MKKLLFVLLILLSSSGFAANLTPTGMDGNGLYNIAHPNDTLVLPGNLAFSGSAPTIAAGTGAGTTPTVSISGNNNSGQITVTTGTLPSGSNAVVATITLSTAFPNAVNSVTITPANAAAAALSGSGSIFGSISGASTFILNAGITSLVGGTTYKFNYSCGGW